MKTKIISKNQVSLRLPASLTRWIDRIAASSYAKRSEIIRRILAERMLSEKKHDDFNEEWQKQIGKAASVKPKRKVAV